MNCPKCNRPMSKNGVKAGKQQYTCNYCRSRRMINSDVPATTKTVGLSESQLRQKHDTNFIVNSKCGLLSAGTFLTTPEFVVFCGIRPGAGYRNVIDHPDYDVYRGKAGGQVYWSHPTSIKKLKEEGVLS